MVSKLLQLCWPHRAYQAPAFFQFYTLSTSISVSYTHLDVYKRQLVRCVDMLDLLMQSNCSVYLIASKATSSAAFRSSTSSIPMDNLIVEGVMPCAYSSSSLSCEWVVLAGWITSDFTSATFARSETVSYTHLDVYKRQHSYNILSLVALVWSPNQFACV